MNESNEIITVKAVDVISEARKLIGTPWHHTQRVPGVGIDCAGLLVVVSNNVGVPVEDDVHYTLADEFNRLIGHIEKYCNKINSPSLTDVIMPADIVVFRGRSMMNHCGIYTNLGTMIHAYDGSGVHQVVEQQMDISWWGRLDSVYRYKGITWQP